MTNEQIDLELEKIFDENLPHKNYFGFEQNINSRLDNYCQLISYYTDEAKLNIAISRLDELFQTNEFSNEIENFQKKLSTELYSPIDLTKIKAIFISKKAEYILFKRSFASSPDIQIPDFECKLTNIVFTHNLPSVIDITSRNIDAKEKDYILNLPENEAIIYINKNIGRLEILDHQHRTNISSEKIEFYKKTRKLVYNNRKLKMQGLPQQIGSIKYDEKYKTLNLFKVGLLFATGEMSKYYTINNLNEIVLNSGLSPRKIAEELKNVSFEKYILASKNNYKNGENKSKNIFNNLDMMTKIIAHCNANKLHIDPYFVSRLPIE